MPTTYPIEGVSKHIIATFWKSVKARWGSQDHPGGLIRASRETRRSVVQKGTNP
jgi:hypothetical protein